MVESWAKSWGLNHGPKRSMVVLGVLAAGLTYRLWLPVDGWFWFDEIYGATFASGTFYEALIGPLRFDLHPPLYYVQLRLWAVVDAGDSWLRLNSAAWGLGAAGLAWVVARRCLGEREAWIALLLMMVVPAAVATAQDLRMYPMLMALTLLTCWGVLLRHFSDHPRAGAWLMAAAGVAAAYTHATGFLVPCSAALFSLLLWATSPSPRVTLKAWALVNGLVAAASIPAMANTAIRSVGHMRVPDAGEVATTLARLVLDQAVLQHPALLGLGVLLVGAACVGAWRSPLRWAFVAYVVVPVLLLLAVSHLGRPVWHFRALYPLTPFLVLGIAVVLARAGDGLAGVSSSAWKRWIPTAFVVAGMAIVAAGNAAMEEKSHRYPDAVGFVQQHIEPGDIVWAPDFVTAWAVKRYWIGPHWGSITRIQGEPSSEQWRRVYERLGDVWLQRIGLAPEARRVDAGANGIYTGPGLDAGMLGASRIWLVGGLDDPQAARLRAEGYVPQRLREFRGVEVAEFVATEGRAPLMD